MRRLTDWPGTRLGRSVPLVPRVDVTDVADKSRSKRQAGRDGPVAAPLPVAKNGAPRSIAGEPALVVPERKFQQIIGGEFVRLVEAGEAALRGEIKGILRDAVAPLPAARAKRRRHASAGAACAQSRTTRSRRCARADGRRIIDGFGKCIDAADGESLARRLRTRTEPALASESATEFS